MNKSDARKILSELKGAHAFVPADEEKTVDVISKMIAGKPWLQADPRFLENLRSRLLSEASAPLSKPWRNAWQSFAKFLSVPVALAGIAAIAGSIGILDVKKPASPWDAPKYPVAMTFTDAPETRTDGETAPTSLSATDDALRSPEAAEFAKPAEKTVPKSVAPDSAPEATSDLRAFSEHKTEVSDADAARMASPLALEDVENAISSVSEDSQADMPAGSMESFAGPMAMGTPSELSDSAAWSAMLKTGTPTVSERTYRYAYSGDLPAIPSKMVAYVRVSAIWSAESTKETWLVDGFPVYDASGNARTETRGVTWKTESAVFVHPSASKAMEWLARSGSSERGSTEIVLDTAKVGYLSTVTQAGWTRKETLVPAIVFSTGKAVPEGENFATTIVVPLVEMQE